MPDSLPTVVVAVAMTAMVGAMAFVVALYRAEKKEGNESRERERSVYQQYLVFSQATVPIISKCNDLLVEVNATMDKVTDVIRDCARDRRD